MWSGAVETGVQMSLMMNDSEARSGCHVDTDVDGGCLSK